MEELRIDPTISYDVVALPSRGIHYSSKKKQIRVAHLTASDENILMSPNFKDSDLVFDELLKRKIIDKDIPFDEIVEEDKKAILIFLRNTAFGSAYKVQIEDPKTKKLFTAEINLDELTFTPFDLVEDINGEYEYFLQTSGTKITFKFLNNQQQKELERLKENWKENDGVAPIMTKRLEMMIKSVNGNRDMMSIYQFIQKMPIKDSQDFRKYVNDNRPSIDLLKTVQTPSGEDVYIYVDFGVEFFRPFYGI